MSSVENTLARGEETNSNSVFGFWLYIMTDCVIFGSLFATFIVLRNSTNGGPSGAELFSMPYVLAETVILLTSSFTSGLALLSCYQGEKKQAIKWLVVTFLLGLTFLGLELNEFSNLYEEGYSWRHSAFLSAFFTLVGTHGLHITAGLTWLAVMVWRINKKGLNKVTLRRLTAFSLFWHFLDIIWIFIFTIVFLMGENPL